LTPRQTGRLTVDRNITLTLLTILIAIAVELSLNQIPTTDAVKQGDWFGENI
jgi:hypothetical protein